MRAWLFYPSLVLYCLLISTFAQSQLQKIYLHPKAAGNEKQSRIVDSIRFIPLEVKDGIELTTYNGIDVTKNYFLIKNYADKKILLYSKNGTFSKEVSYKKLGDTFYPVYDEYSNRIVFFGNNKNYTLTSRDRLKIMLDWNNPRNKKYYKKYVIDLDDASFTIKKDIPAENDMLTVNVYSRSALVRLELNGKIIGEKNISDSTKLTAKFEVPYEPGELKAIAIEEGKEIGTVILKTANPAKTIRLKADRSAIHANRNDLSYVMVEIVDDNGNVVPNANIPVEFSISGEGALAGVGNANPMDMASFKQPKRNTFRGRCLVVLRPNGKAGDIVLEAKAQGLQPAKTIVTTNK